MEYVSTRGGDAGQAFSSILLAGTASDGGLYMPQGLAPWPEDAIERLRHADYASVATELIAHFAGDSMDRGLIEDAVGSALATFRHPAIAPHRQLDQDRWLLELFHGSTLAFKDHALQIVGELVERQLAQEGRRATVVCATSGDTGAAAAAAFAGRDNVSVVVLHPEGRVSEVQRRQMTTLEEDNVFNYAVDGDFDDCQAMVKALFVDPEARPLNLTAVNSINWARITAQIAYYAWSSLRLSGGGPVHYVVPTGNFGNILAGDVARTLGFPVGRLALSSNDNDVLPRFFAEGRMQRRETVRTISPSMDIQVSSNFERALWIACEGDASAVAEYQRQLTEEGGYKLAPDALERLRARFAALRCTETDALEEMARTHHETGELLCPHTATAAWAARTLRHEGPVVAVATAHPAKFPEAVRRATGEEPPRPPLLDRVMQAEERYDRCPADAARLRDELLRRAAG